LKHPFSIDAANQNQKGKKALEVKRCSLPIPGRTEKGKKFSIPVFKTDIIQSDQTSIFLSDVFESHTGYEYPLTLFFPFRRSWVVDHNHGKAGEDTHLSTS
jgi:hypothetical protein